MQAMHGLGSLLGDLQRLAATGILQNVAAVSTPLKR